MTIDLVRRLLHSIFRQKRLLYAVSLALSGSNIAVAQSWINFTGSGNTWSTASNWNPGLPAFNATSVLTFDSTNFTAGSYSAVVDGATTYTLNQMLVNGAGLLTLSSDNAAGTISFVGSNPILSVNGMGGLTLNNGTNTTDLTLTASGLTVAGGGLGSITFAGTIGGTGSLTINRTAQSPKYLGSSVILAPASGAGNNTFVGTVTLTSGNLVIDQTNGLALGNSSNVLVVNGGSLQAISAPLILANNIQLGGTFHFTGTQSGTFLGTVTGSGDIRTSTTGTTTFQNTISATGTITTEGYGAPSTLTLSTPVSAGTHGTALTASSISINNSTLNLDNTNANATRLNTAGILNLNTGRLALTTNGSINAVERVAALNLTGGSQITFTTSSTRSARFTADVIAPSVGGTFLAVTSGTSTLGGNVGLLNNNNLFFSNLTASSNINGVLPYGYATPSTASVSARGGLVRYDVTNGVVPLNFNDYSGRLPQGLGSQPTFNLLWGTANTFASTGNGISNFNGSMTANSVSLDSISGANVGNSVYGTGTITLTSGALAFSISSGSTASAVVPSVMQPNLNFGGVTGYIHAQNNFVQAGSLIGSNGLVKAGAGSMTLLAASPSFSGGFTVNQGTVFISDENQLGASGGSVTLNSGYGGGIGYMPTNQFGSASVTSLTVNRNLSLGTNGGSLSTAAGNTMTWNGIISGNGPLIKSGTGLVLLSNANTYTGDTVISAGSLAVTHSQALGSSGNTVFLSGGYLQSNTTVTVPQDIVVRVNPTITSPTIVTNADMTLTGNLGNIQGIGMVKVGPGNLILTGSNSFNQSVQLGYQTPTHVSGSAFALPPGSLTLAGANGALPYVNNMFMFAGSSLIIDHSAGVLDRRMSAANYTFNGGMEFKVVGNASNSLTTATGSHVYQSSTINTYTLDQPASGGNGRSVSLTIPSTSSVFSQFNYYRGTNLGVPSPTDDYTILRISSFAPSTGVVGYYSASPTGGPQDFATYTAANGIERYTSYAPLPSSGSSSTVNYSSTGSLTLAGVTLANTLKMTNSQIDLAGFSMGPTGAGAVLSTGAMGQDIITTSSGSPVFGFQSGQVARVSVNNSLQIGTAASPIPIVQTTDLEKFGPGVLILSGSTFNGTYQINQGSVQLLTNNFVNVTTVNLLPGTTFDINGQGTVASPFTVNTLTGFGTVNLGSGAIRYGTATGTFAGGFAGTGTVSIQGGFFQTLNGNSPGFSGDIRIGAGAGGVAGVIIDADVIPSNGATPGPFGTGTTPIQLGATSGAGVALLIHTSLVNRVERDISIGQGGTGTVTIGSTTTSAGAYTNYTGNITLASSRALALIGGAQGNTSAVGGNTIFSGAISGAGLTGNSAIAWNGGNISLWGSNTFTGNILVNSGRANVMGLGSDSAWGSSTNVVNIADATATGIFRADNGSRTLNNPISYLGATVSSTLGFTGTNDLTLNGNINLGTTANSSTRTWEVTSLGTTTINGVITGNTALIKEGAGSLILNGVNTFSGDFTMNGGTVGIGVSTSVGVSGSIGTGQFNLNGGTLMAIGGARTLRNLMAIGGSFGFDGNNDLTITPTGSVNMGNAPREIAVLGNGVLRLNGTHTGGTISGFIKTGPGTLILGGSNVYGTSGTNVIDGKLLINNAFGSATGVNPVTVQSAGTIGGNGFISGSVTVNGTLSPGMNTGSSTDIVSINNNLIMNSGSLFRVEIGSYTGGTPPTPGIDYDQVALTAASSTYTIGPNVTLQGVRLGNFVVPNLTAWVILDNTNVTANSGTGTFNGLPDGATFLFDNQIFQIRYNVGTYQIDPSGLVTLTPGGRIVIAAVPEPTTWGLIGLSMAAAGYWGYRRMRTWQKVSAEEVDRIEEELST
ncbi:MAG: autotransporter-associated beta strand repeat-containing protein [Gemmatales bacterium]